jgi:hypothetical protein
VVPLGRQHLFYCRQVLKQAKEIAISPKRKIMGVVVTSAASRELEWWIHQLDYTHETGLPLASRYSFPGTSSDSHLIRYSDAAREQDAPLGVSGGGAFCVMDGIFYYVHVEWTREELISHSINVLEAHARDLSGKVFFDKARELGKCITHTTAYIDNSTAEAIAENGRTSTAMLHELNKLRLTDRLERGISESNERIASIDNDVADLISRGKVSEALRFPEDCGLACVELQAGRYRDLPHITVEA